PRRADRDRVGEHPRHHRLRGRHRHVPAPRRAELQVTVSKKVGAIIGTAIGVGIAGTAIAVGMTRNKKHGEPEKVDKLGALRPDREYTVITEDGIELSVEEVDPVDGGK